jgi:fibro-slime domain-containing protein
MCNDSRQRSNGAQNFAFSCLYILCAALLGWSASPVHAAVTYMSGQIFDFCSASFTPCSGVSPHPNFETGIDVQGALTGVVEPTLGDDFRPVFKEPAQITFTNAFDFNSWYRSTSFRNENENLGLFLEQNPNNPNVYTYDNSHFFPLDNQLLGNQGLPHNYHFTYTLFNLFDYQGGEVLNYRSDDDLWVFINGKLALEMAGTHNAESGTIDLDAQASDLGITKGGAYDIRIFYAERQTTKAELRIDVPKTFGNFEDVLSLTQFHHNFIVGDKIFSGFTKLDCAPGPGFPNFDGVRVEGIDGTQPGIAFDGSTRLIASPGEKFCEGLEFDVTPFGTGQMISGASVDLSDYAIEGGKIAIPVLLGDNGERGRMDLLVDPSNNVLQTENMLSLANSMGREHVGFVVDATGGAEVRDLEFRFAQTNPVTEPGTIGLIGIALAAAIGLRVRRT